jgi:hypothetical protein
MERAGVTGSQVANSTALKLPFLGRQSLGGLLIKKADATHPLKPPQEEMLREDVAPKGKFKFDFLRKRPERRVATGDGQENPKIAPALIVDEVYQKVGMGAQAQSPVSRGPHFIDQNHLLKDMPKEAALSKSPITTDQSSIPRDVREQAQGAAHQTPKRAWPNQAPRTTFQHKTEAAKENFLRERMLREVRLLNQSILEADQSTRASSGKARAVLIGDSAWIEDVMKDIAQKGDEVKEQSASIPIITTTGCDLPMRKSSRKQERSIEEKEFYEEEKSLSLSQSTPLRESPSWPASQRSRASNILQSSEMMPTLAASTLEKHPMPLDRAKRRTLSQTANVRSPRRQTQGEFNKSPMSMCTLLRTPRSNQSSTEETMECSAQRESLEPSLTESQVLILPSMEDPLESTSLAMMPWSPPLAQVRGFKTQPGTRDFISSLMERYPGTYPCYLDDEEDTAVHFMALVPRDSEWGVLPSLAECVQRLCVVLRELRNNVGSLFRLYISLVRPFFDSSSDYWSRNGRGESTWVDSAVVMLAIPPGILATVTLV